MTKAKNARKRLFTLILALAMVLTSVAVPTTTAEAAKTVKVKKVQITNPKKKTVTLVKGKTLQIKVKITPSNAKNKKVTYKSSKKKIASVTSKGKVKGIKKGTAKITVTAKDGSKKKATLTVKVVNPVKVKTVKLNKTSVSIDIGKTYTLKASISPNNATDKTVSWTTSNKAVATVTSKGVVKGVKAGTATITATAKDGSKKKATCKVTVKAASTPNPPDNPNPPGPGPDDPNPPAEKTLDSIEITTAPTKTAYIAGEKIDLTGMVVTAKYSDDTTKVLETSEYTTRPDADTILTTSHSQLSVSYKEGNVTRSATTPLTVTGVESIRIKTQPTRVTYEEGQKFDPAGMVVEAVLAGEGETEVTQEITGYTYSTEDLEVTAGAQYSKVKISYKTGNSTTLEAKVDITVTAKNPLKSISVELVNPGEPLPRADGCFQDDDVTITATFEDNTTKTLSVEDCQVDPAVFTKDTTSATVTYWYGGISKDAVVDGFTVKSYSQGYTFDDADGIGVPVKRANENTQNTAVELGEAEITPEFVDGLSGKALKMDGTYGLWLNKIAGTDSESYSISMWVKPESLKNSQPLVTSTSSKFGVPADEDETWCTVAGDNQGTGSIKLWSHDANGYVEDHKQGTISVGENAEWSHIVLVVDGTKTKSGAVPAEGAGRTLGTLYVNGRKVYSADVANEKANGRGKDMMTYFGANAWPNDGYFKGLVDEFVFTNDVLTEDDVEKYYLENIEATGNTLTDLSSVSPDNGVEVVIPYGTTLADLKRELVAVAYKAKAVPSGEEISIPTTSDMWTVEDYTVTKEGEVTATARIDAPKGYLFKIDGKLAMSVTRTVKVKITDPTIISFVTPSATSITVPYGQSEDEIVKALKEQITFTAATEDGTPYTVTSGAGTWKLTKKEAPAAGYDAVFELENPAKVGYKYKDGIEVKVTVSEQAATEITALTADKTQIEVVAGTEESLVKSQLAALKLTATVGGDAEAPSFTNAAELWTIAGYDKDTADTYTATAALTAPVGYKFAEGVGTVSVNVVVEEKTEERTLKSIAIAPTSTHKTKVIVGHAYDKTGLVVTASYTNSDTEDVSSKVTLDTKEVYNTIGKETITISYTDGEGDAAKTETTSFELSVVKVEDGAVALYGFEGNLQNSADTTKTAKVVADVSLNDSTEAPNYQDGLKGQGILFNADGKARTGIQLAESIASGKTDFTLNLWVKLESEPVNWGEVVMGTNASKQKQLMLYAYPGSEANGLEAQLTDNAAKQQRFHSALIKGQWRMLTWVNNASGTKFYIDGENKPLDEGKDLVVQGGVGRFVIGAGAWGDYFHGSIDEVSLYDLSLSQKEVTELYGIVKPTIASVTLDKEEIEMLKADVGEANAGILAKLAELNIQTTMKNGEAVTFTNDTDWTLTESANGYTAIKKLQIPTGYVVAGQVAATEITLTVNVVVKEITLTSISVKTAPNKVYYNADEAFDAAGIVVEATYSDGSKKEVGADAIRFAEDTVAVLPDDATTATVQQEVTISYTEGGLTEDTTLEITVINPDKADELITKRIAYYTFENSLANHMDGSTAAWVQNADGNAAGASKVAYAQGKKGSGLQIGKDGATDILKLDKNIQSSEFTINFWVKAPSVVTEDYNPIICCTSLAKWERNLVIYVMPKTATGIKIFREGGADLDYENDVLSTEDWQMFTWVNTDGTMTLYKNGEIFVTSTSTIQGLPNILLGGQGGAFADPVFQGVFDEVSVYNVPLDETQVKDLYDSVNAPTQQPETPEVTE